MADWLKEIGLLWKTGHPWASPYEQSPVSRLALYLAMPKRDLAREAELTRKAEVVAEAMRRGMSDDFIDSLRDERSNG